MPRGASDIPSLRLEVLQKFITTFQTPPNLVLMNLFPSSISPSSTIKWESQRGGRGMTPFVPPGAPAPTTAPHGVASHSAEAAFWKEKMYMDEEFLNNIRKEGTESDYLAAQQRLARELALLVNRNSRRKEWMFAQMLTEGSFTYSERTGTKISVDYSLDSNHKVTLGSSAYWDTGGSKDILGDVRDGKQLIAEDCGGKVDYCMCNSNVLKMMADDSTFRGYFENYKFGGQLGDMFKQNMGNYVGVNPKAYGNILDIPNFIIYDEVFEHQSFLTASVTGGSTTWISVADVADFRTGEKMRFHDASAGTYEDRYIISISVETGRVQVSSPPDNSYKAAEDYVTMRAFFIPDDKFIMFASKVDGMPIAEYKEAPFGLDRHYGVKTDRKDVWDPEGTYIRCQNKGLPILYHRDAMYILDVTATSGQAATSTTTSSSTTTTAP